MTFTFAASRHGKRHAPGPEKVPAVPARRPRSVRVRRSLTGWAFVGPGTAVVVGLSLFPAVWAFLISRTRWNGIAPARDIGWTNYQRMVDDPDLLAAVRHSLALTAMFVPASLVLGVLVAVALNQRIRFIAFYRTCIFVPYVVSAATTGIIASYVFNPQFGAINDGLRRLGLPAQKFLESPSQALPTVCVVALWGSIGFTAVVYLAALQDVPKELVEAATVDGAGPWQAFRNVTLPHLRPVTLFLAVWQTITALQLFDLIYTTTRGGPLNSTQTIVYFVYEVAFRSHRFGYGAAAAYLLFAVTMLLTGLVIWYNRRRGSEAF
ncbi:carbohydrate ABC transporter permease [Virgisporangium aurantiacum]|uniref:ABC transporter permease n=1 Tax=Virgisporangium aurantiacum TaxID=175570 RepID=A0A8J3ZIT6_9ACTN|nr:sugar ABC transporter permease [Virgisporangium aurantiacum]GIJ63558.1 ABC transporter permease [Virgisporangium aurantiacum]